MCLMVSLPVVCWLWVSFSCLTVNPLHLCYKHKRVNGVYGNNRCIVVVIWNTLAHYVRQQDSRISCDTCHCVVWDGTVPWAGSRGLPRCEHEICGNKTPTRRNRWYLLQILLHAQHVSDNTMSIIRSSRVLYRWSLPVVFGALVFKLSVWWA